MASVIIIHLLQLLFPILIPSWRFFDEIAPSPRIEFTSAQNGAPLKWQPLCSTPQTLSIWQIIGRLFYNAKRNEDLFMASCAERLIQGEEHFATPHILSYIARHYGVCDTPIQFRLIFHYRENNQIVRQQQLYISEILIPNNGLHS